MIRRKIACPLTKCVHILECPLIRDFTAFVNFPFSRAWAGVQCSFSRTTSLLVFFVLKTGEISHYFPYQRAQLFAGNKITCTVSLYLENTKYVSPSSNHSKMRSRKSWELFTLSS